MFDFGDNGGLGFQLSTYRLIDGMRDNHRRVAEAVQQDRQWQQAQADYNRLLAYAHGLERDLEQRNQQLASTQQELAQVKAAFATEQRIAHEMIIARQNLAKAREQARLLGSQPT